MCLLIDFSAAASFVTIATVASLGLDDLFQPSITDYSVTLAPNDRKKSMQQFAPVPDDEAKPAFKLYLHLQSVLGFCP